MNLGSAVLLVVPIELVSSRLSRRVEAVASETSHAVGQVREDVRLAGEDTARQVESIRQDVEGVRAQVASMSDFGQRIAERIAAENDADEASFRALGEDAPTRDAVVDALRRAQLAGVVSRWGPRAEAHVGEGDYVHLNYTPGPWGDGELTFDLQAPNGGSIGEVRWDEGVSAEEVMLELARALRRDGTFISDWWKRISETLLVGASHHARREIVELVPPQWAVTDKGIVPYPDNALRGLGPGALRAQRAIIAVKDWPWVDADSADEAAARWLALFGATDDPWETS